ncbi:hypothetical protein DRQ20_02905 [bacterium]|nr:MAG: hypothetical protein DRQ20_02905 [bacterium]
MKRYLYLFVLVSFISGCRKGVEMKTWERVYDKGILFCVREKEEGGYWITGMKIDEEGNGRFYLASLDADGEIIWESEYGEGYGVDIEPLEDGGCLVSCVIRDLACICRMNEEGAILWKKNLLEEGDAVFFIGRASDGNYLITFRDSILKFDINGNILQKWKRTGYSFGIVIEDADGNLVTVDDDEWVVKMDPAGNILWEKDLDDWFGYEDLWELKEAIDGGYILGGRGDDKKMCVLKLDKNGNVVWVRHYEDDKYEYGMVGSIQPEEDEYIVAGFTANGEDGWDVKEGVLMKIDTYGNTVWEKRYSYNGNPRNGFFYVEKTRDGGYIMAGWTSEVERGEDETFSMWVVKVNEEGEIVEEE